MQVSCELHPTLREAMPRSLMKSFPFKTELGVAFKLDSPGKTIRGQENHTSVALGPGPAFLVREFCVLSPLPRGREGRLRKWGAVADPHWLLLSPSLQKG